MPLERLSIILRGNIMALFEYSIDGDYSKLKRYLEHLKNVDSTGVLDECGKMGVDALQQATPKRTGKTANSWRYRIEYDNDGKPAAISWYNTNYSDGESVAILIQYGHMSANGYYIEGRDYINPAMEPVFDEIVNKIMEEVEKYV